MENKTTLTILAVPALVAVILVLAAQIRFGAALTAQEQALLNFHGGDLPEVFHREKPVVGLLSSPIPLTLASEKDYPRELLSDLAPADAAAAAAKRSFNVSLIVVAPGKRFAIINGTVAREGDTVDLQRVVRIERNRVLLKSKEGERWLRLE
jgi:hypothetical protein